MLYTRYRLARDLAANKDVLELACGAGFGLGYIGAVAKRVVGTDVDPEFVRRVSEHFGDRIDVHQVDASQLPFSDATFDCVFLFEAVYYLLDVQRFVKEARRVLRPKGTLVIVSANPERRVFNPGEYTTKYFSAAALTALLTDNGFKVEVFGAFRDAPESNGASIVRFLRGMAVRLHLIPKTMRAKEFLKRVFVGRLHPIPREIHDGMAALEPLIAIPSDSPCADFKVIYALARL